MTVTWCHICRKQDEVEMSTPLEQFLPEGYEHRLCSHEVLEGGEAFRATLKLQLQTREEVQRWLEALERSSHTTWRVAKTYPGTENSARHNKYRVDYRCQHNTTHPTVTIKNTFCPALLYLILKKNTFSQNRRSRSADCHNQEGFVFHVTIKNQHNHAPIWHGVPSKETVKKLAKLLDSGHSPNSAVNTIKHHLQEEQGKLIIPDNWFVDVMFEKDVVLEETAPIASGLPEHSVSAPGEGSAGGQDHLESRLSLMFEGILERLRHNDSFLAPVESMVSAYERITTDCGLLSALSTFGAGGVGSSSAKHPKARARKGMSTEIGGASAAVARRKAPPGSKQPSVAGQSPKRARKDHT